MRNKLSRVGSAATYLEDQQPHIWFTVEIRLTQPQVELELGLSLAIYIYNLHWGNDCSGQYKNLHLLIHIWVKLYAFAFSHICHHFILEESFQYLLFVASNLLIDCDWPTGLYIFQSISRRNKQTAYKDQLKMVFYQTSSFS